MTRERPASSLSRWLWIAVLLAVVGWAFWRSVPGMPGMQGDWAPFESPEGGFSIEAPGVPTARTKSVKTAVGEIPLHLFVLEHGRFSFMASYSDYPEAIFARSTPQTMLDGARDGAAANIQGTVERETPIALDGNPGRSVVMSDSTGELLLQVRLLLVGRRLYQFGVVSSRTDRSSQAVSRYLESFRLIGPD